jgi:hypothetical protein
MLSPLLVRTLVLTGVPVPVLPPKQQGPLARSSPSTTRLWLHHQSLDVLSETHGSLGTLGKEFRGLPDTLKSPALPPMHTAFLPVLDNPSSSPRGKEWALQPTMEGTWVGGGTPKKKKKPAGGRSGHIA